MATKWGKQASRVADARKFELIEAPFRLKSHKNATNDLLFFG